MNAGILVVGIGGQGVMTAAETIARAALAAGLDPGYVEPFDLR